jgi:hypothetical protein
MFGENSLDQIFIYLDNTFQTILLTVLAEQ